MMLPKDLPDKIKTLLEPIAYNNFLTPEAMSALQQRLNELEQLINQGCAPKDIYNLLFIANSKIALSLGMACAASKDTRLALKYINLLNTLMERGITVTEINTLLQTKAKNINTGGLYHLGMVLAQEQNASVLKAYFELLNTLLINGLPAQSLFQLVSFSTGNGSLQTRVLYHQDASIVEINFQLLETLIKRGIPTLAVKEIFNATQEQTLKKLITYLKQDPARLYRYINLDILPDSIYSDIKGMKEKIYDAVLKTSRTEILDACMKVDDEKTSLHRLMKQRRGLFATRPGHGMFKVWAEKRDEILRAMEREDATRARIPVSVRAPVAVSESQPRVSAKSGFQLVPMAVPSPAPAPIAQSETNSGLYPYQYVDSNGVLQWATPAPQSFVPSAPPAIPLDAPPPSFVSEMDAPPLYTKPFITVLPQGPLVNFVENEPPVRKQENPVSSILYAGMFPPVPKEEPQLSEAEKESQQQTNKNRVPLRA